MNIGAVFSIFAVALISFAVNVLSPSAPIATTTLFFLPIAGRLSMNIIPGNIPRCFFAWLQLLFRNQDGSNSLYADFLKYLDKYLIRVYLTFQQFL